MAISTQGSKSDSTPEDMGMLIGSFERHKLDKSKDYKSESTPEDMGLFIGSLKRHKLDSDKSEDDSLAQSERTTLKPSQENNVQPAFETGPPAEATAHEAASSQLNTVKDDATVDATDTSAISEKATTTDQQATEHLDQGKAKSIALDDENIQDVPAAEQDQAEGDQEDEAAPSTESRKMRAKRKKAELKAMPKPKFDLRKCRITKESSVAEGKSSCLNSYCPTSLGSGNASVRKGRGSREDKSLENFLLSPFSLSC